MASAASGSGSAASSSSERGKAFVQVLSCVLSRLVAANDPVPDPGPVTKFHALRPPSISILDYCARIHKYASCSPECFVLALVYIDRLIQRNSLLLTSLNVHRIIITAVMLAAKFFDDQYFNNAYYAKVGGVPTSEVNALELEFLFSINFSLHVPTDIYEKYYAELANHMGVGVPAELMAGNTCDCSRFAQAIGYTHTELANTGMRSLDEMAAESLAAFADQQSQMGAPAGAADPAAYAATSSASQAAAYGGGGDGDASMMGAGTGSGGGGLRSAHHGSMDVDASYSGSEGVGYSSSCCAPIAPVPVVQHTHCFASSSSSSCAAGLPTMRGSSDCGCSATATTSTSAASSSSSGHWRSSGCGGIDGGGGGDRSIDRITTTGTGITSGPGRSYDDSSGSTRYAGRGYTAGDTSGSGMDTWYSSASR